MAAKAPATLALIVINVVFYIAQQMLPHFTTSLFAYSPAIASGEWYRLVSAMFLHESIMHIGFNMLALYYLGPMVEDLFGTPRFLVAYLVSGVFASAVSFLIAPINSPSLGASGAIFGIFAVVMVLAYNRRSNPGASALLRNLIGLLVLNAALFFVVPNIDIWAHVGGFLAGALLGFAFDHSKGSTRWSAVDFGATALLMAAAVIIVVARTAAIKAGNPFL
jgi:membrane associated rhomboid family serine protease